MAVINGTNGMDTLAGTHEDDEVHGLRGNDVLLGSAGADALDGGAGFDTADYSWSGAGINIDLGRGVGKPGIGGDAEGDTLNSIEKVIGSQFDDTFTTSVAGRTLEGGGGNDTYIINAVGSKIIEQSGWGYGYDDQVLTSLAHFILDENIERLTYTGTGKFTGYGNASDNVITGGAGNDVLLGGGGADHLIGGAGRDTASYADSTEGLTIGMQSGIASSGIAQGDTYTSIELIRGSNYDDHFWADEASIGFDGGDGFDTVDYSSTNGAVTVDLRAGVGLPGGGSAEGDTLAHVEKVIGSYGNDTFTSSIGGVTFEGGLGNDVYNVDAEGVTIIEQDFIGGYDELRTGLAVKTLDSFVEKLTYTGTADFTGYGNDLENIIQGGQGNDLLFGGDGADTFIGGEGVDVVSYGDSQVGVSLNLDTRVFSGIADHDQYFDIEILRGSHFNDTLTGNFIASNYFEGGLGDDVIKGGIFADHLYGGSGPSNGPSAEVDTGRAPQADMLYGGNGDDVIVTAVDDRGSFAYGEGGNDTITVASGTAEGGWDNDVLTGTGNNYVLLGEQGDDQLIMNDSGFANGGEGDDTYIVNTSNLVTIRDDSQIGFNDTLILNNVATAADLNLMRVGDDLYLYSRDDHQAVVPDHGVKLQDWYAGGNSIENFTAANGDILAVRADAFSLFG